MANTRDPSLSPGVTPSRISFPRNCVLLWTAAVSLLVAVGAYLGSFGLQSVVERAELVVTAQSGSQTKRVVTYPFLEDLGGQPLSGILEFTVIVPVFRETRYVVSVDDCVDWVEVNGIRVTAPFLPYCNYAIPVTIDFGPQLRVGSNIVRFGYRNTGGPGGMRFRVAPQGAFIQYLRSLEIFCLTAFFLSIAALLVRYVGVGVWIAIPFLLGVGLRILYFIVTPIGVREYDFDGHVEYIKKVATILSIPRFHEGWQGYQPPLYYAISAGVYRVSMFFGADSQHALLAVRLLSVAMSIGMLYLSIALISRLPFKGYSRMGILLSSSIVAVLPSLVMASTRINNDSLAQPLQLVVMFLLYTWWTTGAARFWYGSIIVMCLAFLTKATALTLVPPCILCFLFAKRVRLREKFVLACGAFLIVYVLVGWYVVFRMYVDGQTHLVGNATHLTGALKIDNSLHTLTIFNPLQVFEHPYNNNYSDDARRAYFWEYVVRGVFFGEFNFGEKFLPYAQYVLALFMILCLFAIAGGWISFSLPTLPFCLFFISQIAGLVAARTQFPFSCTQDVRYILVAAIPLAFYVAQGCVAFSKTWRYLGILFLIPFLALCCYFVCFLFMG